MTFSEVFAQLKEAGRVFCKPGTERVAALCANLGHPERAFHAIHITGTNGKGSTALMLASVLHEAGYRVGQFSSPYLSDPTECIRIENKQIDKRRFTKAGEKVLAAASEMIDPPTEFELLTVIAFVALRDAAVEIAVIEVCMGGRLDATNVLKTPLLSVITGVSVDHTAFLGDTVREIALVKAGIIKEKVPVLYGGDDSDAEAVIRAEALRLSAPFHKTRYDKLSPASFTLNGTRFSYDGIKDITLSLLGTYQLKNAATALSALALLRNRLPRIDAASVQRGFASLTWQGRFERLSVDPPLFFDGAHNPEGVFAAAQSIRTYFKDGIILISGVLRDKDYRTIAATLAPLAKAAFTITPKSARALTAEAYALALCDAGIPAIPCQSAKRALQKAREKAKELSLPILCLGSLYLYDAVKKACDLKNTF